MTDLPHNHTSPDVCKMNRALKEEHVTQDSGMEIGTGPVRHQCRAMGSHHMESNNECNLCNELYNSPRGWVECGPKDDVEDAAISGFSLTLLGQLCLETIVHVTAIRKPIVFGAQMRKNAMRKKRKHRAGGWADQRDEQNVFTEDCGTIRTDIRTFTIINLIIHRTS